MGSRETGEITIRLDRTRRLKFDLNAIASFEEATGRPMAQQNEMNSGIREARAMLWAGLLHEMPDLTLEDAGRLFMQANGDTFEEKLTYVSGILAEAVAILFPGGKKKTESSEESGAGKRRKRSPSVHSASSPTNSGD